MKETYKQMINSNVAMVQEMEKYEDDVCQELYSLFIKRIEDAVDRFPEANPVEFARFIKSVEDEAGSFFIVDSELICCLGDKTSDKVCNDHDALLILGMDEGELAEIEAELMEK